MIKAITLVQPAGPDPAAYERLREFFSALGFAPGKGWQTHDGQGSSFLAPLGNLEFVTGRMSAVPSILVEVLHLEDVHRVAREWFETHGGESTLSPIAATHWNSRLFTVEPVPGITIGFWQSENPQAGKPAAIEGDLIATGCRFAIVVARWNAVITDRLLDASIDALARSGVRREDIKIVRVPGAWEVPAAARTLAETKNIEGKNSFDAIITLGCLLRGETAHYEAIYNEVARGIGESQQATGVPHAFGVLTCETLDQALDRAGLKAGNKGFEAAIAAIEMVSLTRKLKGGAA